MLNTTWALEYAFILRPGTAFTMSVAVVMLRSCSALSPIGVTAMPTSWMFCSRRCAVTMTSSKRVVAGAGGVSAWSARTDWEPHVTAARSATRTALRTPVRRMHCMKPPRPEKLWIIRPIHLTHPFEDVVRKGTRDLQMVLLGTGPPQNDLGLRKQGARAHADRKLRGIEVERAAACEHVACPGAAYGHGRLALAHVHQRMRKSLKRPTEIRLQALVLPGRRQQQMLVRSEPQGRAFGIRVGPAGIFWHCKTEGLACRVARGPSALQDEACRGQEAPEPVCLRHAGALPPDRRKPVASP